MATTCVGTSTLLIKLLTWVMSKLKPQLRLVAAPEGLAAPEADAPAAGAAVAVVAAAPVAPAVATNPYVPLTG